MAASLSFALGCLVLGVAALADDAPGVEDWALPGLAVDDECSADGDDGCALHALQLRGQRQHAAPTWASVSDIEFGGELSDPTSEVALVAAEGYTKYKHWNCFQGGAPSDDGYQGVRSVSSCQGKCSNKYSCLGVVYMNSQRKCWTRGAGYQCSHATSGEAGEFDYYKKGR